MSLLRHAVLVLALLFCASIVFVNGEGMVVTFDLLEPLSQSTPSMVRPLPICLCPLSPLRAVIFTPFKNNFHR